MSHGSFVQDLSVDLHPLYARILLLIKVKTQHIAHIQMPVIQILDNLFFSGFMTAIAAPDPEPDNILLPQIINDRMPHLSFPHRGDAFADMLNLIQPLSVLYSILQSSARNGPEEAWGLSAALHAEVFEVGREAFDSFIDEDVRLEGFEIIVHVVHEVFVIAFAELG